MKSSKPKKTEKAVEPKIPKTILRRSFLLISGVVIVLLGGSTVYAFIYNDKLPAHTTIAGVKVGGMTNEQAKKALADHAENFGKTELTFAYQDKTWKVTPDSIGASALTSEAVDAAWTTYKTGGWQHELSVLASTPFSVRHIDLSFTPISDSGREYLGKTVLSTIETPYQETSLSFVPGNVTVIEGKSGQKLDEDLFERDLYHLYSKGGTNLSLALSEFTPELNSAQAEVARTQAAALLSAPWTLSLPKGVKDVTIEPKEVASFLKTQIDRDGTGKAIQLNLAVKDDVLKELMKSWVELVHVKATNARIAWDGTAVHVTTDGVDGRDLNVDKSLTAISQQIARGEITDHVFATSIEVTRPEVRADTLASLGIKELVGSNTTDFTGSPTNRKLNIARGQSSLDRLLVKSGEVFSTTGTLGPVEESTGYVNELVIKGNRTVPEAGGGLCQVSTTLFRSVLNAGLQITQRTNHAYRVGYYERDTGPGLDATVYIPNPDLKWKNDMATAVYVQSQIDSKTSKITFDIFGTKDGRVSTISKPEILETYPVGQPIYSNTDTLFVGETKQIEHPHDGAKTSVQYSVMRDGKEIYKKTFISVYKAWPAQYLVGTKSKDEAPVPDPTPIP